MDEIYILDAVSDTFGITMFLTSQSWRLLSESLFTGLVVISLLRFLIFFALPGSQREQVIANTSRYLIVLLFLLVIRDYQPVIRSMALGLVDFGRDVVFAANGGEMRSVRADQVFMSGVELGIEVTTRNGLFAGWGAVFGIPKFFLAIFIVWGAFRASVAVVRARVEFAFADLGLSVGMNFAPNDYTFGIFKGASINYVEAWFRYLFTVLFIGGALGLLKHFSDQYSVWRGISFWDALMITGGVWVLGEMAEQVPSKAAAALAGSLNQDLPNPFRQVNP